MSKDANCPYCEEKNAWDGRWYCHAEKEEINAATFNRYCYKFRDYEDCPAWHRNN